MRAIVIREPGGPEVMRLEEVARPVPGRLEVGVKIRATAVNRADLLQRMGQYPAPADAPSDIPGLEFAGEVESVGAGVEGWRVGDRAFGLCGGGAYAEAIAVPARAVTRVPDRLTFEEAAATPEAFITAYDAMVTQAGLGPGERVLVHAVGSGVGSAAIQIARALGARALGTARTEAKLDRAGALGMERGVRVEGARFAEAVLEATDGAGVDVVLELVGGAYLAEDVRCAARRARIMLVGLLAGGRTELDLGAVLQRRLVIRGTVLRSRPIEEKIQAVQTFARHVVPLLDSGAIRPIVDRTYPLAEAAAAHAYVASNQGFGKVVLTC
jgi:putative PIG3 family NAD(P)H quinone oxidoreductase